MGEWEGGIYRQKVIDRDPLALKMLAEQRWDVIPGAESSEAFAERVRTGLSRIVAVHPDQQVRDDVLDALIGRVPPPGLLDAIAPRRPREDQGPHPEHIKGREHRPHDGHDEQGQVFRVPPGGGTGRRGDRGKCTGFPRPRAAAWPSHVSE